MRRILFGGVVVTLLWIPFVALLVVVVVIIVLIVLVTKTKKLRGGRNWQRGDRYGLIIYIGKAGQAGGGTGNPNQTVVQSVSVRSEWINIKFPRPSMASCAHTATGAYRHLIARLERDLAVSAQAMFDIGLRDDPFDDSGRDGCRYRMLRTNRVHYHEQQN